MNAILTYIENLFQPLKDTPETRRAKQELSQMMEDKYHELKAEGASENKAVGRVIADFGDLNELTDALGIREAVESRDALETQALHVDSGQGDEYIRRRSRLGKLIGMGTMLIIASPIPVLNLETIHQAGGTWGGAAEFIGIASLIVLAAAAIVVFILGGLRLSQISAYENSALHLDPAYLARLRRERAAGESAHIAKTVAGVGMIILSPLLPIGAATVFPENTRLEAIAVSLMLLMVGAAVWRLVAVTYARSSRDVLIGGAGRGAASIQPSGKMGRYSGFYWTIVLLIYLAWSFIGDAWQKSWIIWPIASLLHLGIRQLLAARGASKESHPG